MRFGGLDGADDGDGDTVVVEEDGDGGIVVRDIHGEVELDEPPSLVVDDPDEIVLDMRQENESASSPSIVAFRRVWWARRPISVGGARGGGEQD